MATGFDLAERGFCPVRWRAGQRPETFSPEASLGLVDLLLHAHRIEDVEISPPPALSGFLRILAVLTGRITGLDRMDSFEDWEQAREDLLHAGRFDETAIRRYFDEFSGRFELFHTATAHPFLQDARLLEQCRNPQGDQVSSGVNKLVLNRAAGQAFVWHSQRSARPLHRTSGGKDKGGRHQVGPATGHGLLPSRGQKPLPHAGAGTSLCSVA